MKITDVTLTLFAWDDIPATSYGAHTGYFSGQSQLGLLKVQTDEGPAGHAFLGSAMRGANLDSHSLIQVLKPVVLGQDPLQRELLYKALLNRVRQTTYRAIGAMDIALWDIMGQVAGLPLYKVLGAFRESIPAYASSPLQPTPQAYAEEALKIQSAGWAGYKIHPLGNPDDDIAVCRAVREAVGSDYTVMLDSAWAYDYPAAVRVGKAIEELNYLWYEDPLADDDIYNYVKLKQRLDIPILATEYSPGGFHAYAPWIISQATDYLRGDVAVKGGLTAVLKTAHLAEGFRMNYEVHHGGNSLNNLANLHAVLSIPNTSYFEVLLPDASQKYGLVEDITVGSDGLVQAPRDPGLGAQINFELIKRKTIAVLS